jgi:hypothetical protein
MNNKNPVTRPFSVAKIKTSSMLALAFNCF